MNAASSTAAASFAPPLDAPRAAHTVLGLLQRLSRGSLTLQWPDGRVQHFGAAPGAHPNASMSLRNWAVCGAALRSGDIGFAETYIAGDWRTPDLPALMELFIANRGAVEDVIYGSWLGRLAYRLRHHLQRNSRAGSARNIPAHYDLGNDFYRLWLDETMNYSSALFGGDRGRSMAQAQGAKVRRALRITHVRPGDHVLEIGCGWGALAETAATEFGARVTGMTLSRAQLAFARERLARRGIGPGRADLRLQDYRDLAPAPGHPPFDAICSIEMLEAVGRAYWPTYFQALGRLLKPGGRACIQSIVIDDALWPRYIRSTDFIQQYIFPGGCLPCPAQFKQQARAAGLALVDEFAFGADYAETLRRWRGRFLRQRASVMALGFDDRFMRLWEFYLAYCEAAFTRSNLDVVQYTLQKQ